MKRGVFFSGNKNAIYSFIKNLLTSLCMIVCVCVSQTQWLLRIMAEYMLSVALFSFVG